MDLVAIQMWLVRPFCIDLFRGFLFFGGPIFPLIRGRADPEYQRISARDIGWPGGVPESAVAYDPISDSGACNDLFPGPGSNDFNALGSPDFCIPDIVRILACVLLFSEPLADRELRNAGA